MLGLLSQVVSDDNLRGLISNPNVSRQQLQELVLEVCGDGLSNRGRNLVKTLVQGGRLQYTSALKNQYEQMRAAAEDRVDVEVTAAYSLDEQQQDSIAKTVSTRLSKQVNVKTLLDETLIGGAVIRAGDSIIDASLRGRLSELRNELVR